MSITVQWIIVAVLLAVIVALLVYLVRKRNACSSCPLADGCARKNESRTCSLDKEDPA